MEQRLRIIYEDEAMAVCDKPCGVPVQSRRVGVPDLEMMLKRELMIRTGRPHLFLSAVNRLDQPVEGIVLFAKTKAAMAHLSEQISGHTADKYYLTIVEGAFGVPEALLTDYIKKDERQNLSRVVERTDKGGKKAQLEYRVLDTVGTHQLLEIHLLTGRHHQIRVQLSHAGHPIVEDARYNPACQDQPRKLQPALCAYKLSIDHPSTHERLHFIKKPEGKNFEEFARCIQNL